MPISKFNSESGFSVGDNPVVDVIDSTGNVSATNLTVSGVVKSNLIPNSNGVLSLANSSSRYKDIFLSGNFDINGQVITGNNGGLYTDKLTGNTIAINTQLVINSNTDSVSTTTGSFITQGGVGIQKDLTVGGNINLAGANSKGIINFNSTIDSIEFKFS